MSDVAPDYFKLLSLPRRAALDEETVKQAYLRRTRELHPDQNPGGAAEAETLNKAFETLRTSEKRLKHLLELEAPASAQTWRTVTMDAELMALFEKLGPFLQQLGAFQKKKQGATSALARALLAHEEMSLRERAEQLAADLEAQRTELESSLPAIDAGRAAGDASVPQATQVLQAKLAYLSKWQAQVREAFLALV